MKYDIKFLLRSSVGHVKEKKSILIDIVAWFRFSLKSFHFFQMTGRDEFSSQYVFRFFSLLIKLAESMEILTLLGTW